MKVSILSDTHFDYYIRKTDPARIDDADVQSKFNKYLDSDNDVEVLIIAGDMSHYNKQAQHIMKVIAKLFNYKKIFCVLGNHDCYRSSTHPTAARMSDWWTYKDPEGIIEVLNGNVVEYKGVRFGGAMGFAYGTPYISKTLGLSYTKEGILRMYKYYMNDMKYIDGLKDPEDMYLIERDKILDVYKECDVMITHYNPTIGLEGVDHYYRSSPTTGFYCMDCEDLLLEGSMTHWIYGHQHSRLEYTKHGVDVICNPLGYPVESGLANKLTIDV